MQGIAQVTNHKTKLFED